MRHPVLLESAWGSELVEVTLNDLGEVRADRGVNLGTVLQFRCKVEEGRKKVLLEDSVCLVNVEQQVLADVY